MSQATSQRSVVKTFVRGGTRQSGDLSLQITSMADIFIILLLFLLKSFGSGIVDLVPAKGINLPLAEHAEGKLNDTVRLEICEREILVEGRRAAAIEHFAFAPRDASPKAGSRPLMEALQRERDRLAARGASPGSGQGAGGEAVADAAASKPDSRIVVVADQRVPYITIKTVLASAALTGFTDYKLAVASSN